MVKKCEEMNIPLKHLTDEAIKGLGRYPWPGNVRELKNTLVKISTQCHTNTITTDLIPQHIQPSAAPTQDQSIGLAISAIGGILGRSLEEAEKANIAQVLNETNWRKGQACERLGISRPRLRRLIEKYDLQPLIGISPSGPGLS